MFSVIPLILNDLFKELTPLVYSSVNNALAQISPFLDYCQPEQLNCGKFSATIDFF